MNDHSYRNNFQAPSLSTALSLGAVWMTFIAVAAALNVGAAATTGDLISTLAIALGAGALAVFSFVAGLRLRGAEQLVEVRYRDATELSRRPRSERESSSRAA